MFNTNNYIYEFEEKLYLSILEYKNTSVKYVALIFLAEVSRAISMRLLRSDGCITYITPLDCRILILGGSLYTYQPLVRRGLGQLRQAATRKRTSHRPITEFTLVSAVAK